jgi:hypothetical protein
VHPLSQAHGYKGVRCAAASEVNTEVSNTSNFKYLGVTITWSEHIDCMSAKVNQLLGLLRRIKHLQPFNAQILFYNSLALPIFDYADVIWGDKNNIVLMNNLQILQNKVPKIVLDRPFFHRQQTS